MIYEALVFEGLYFNKAGFEISPAELIASDSPVSVWDEAGKYLGDVIRVHRNADRCLEALIDSHV